MTRARARKGRRGEAADAPAVDLADAEIETLIKQLRGESPMRHGAAKEAALRTLRGLLIESARLDALSAVGQLTGDEARSRPAVSSNIRRWLETLGVTGKRDADADDEEPFA